MGVWLSTVFDFKYVGYGLLVLERCGRFLDAIGDLRRKGHLD